MKFSRERIKNLVSKLRHRKIYDAALHISSEELEQLLYAFNNHPILVKEMIDSESMLNLDYIDFSSQDLRNLDFLKISFNHCIFNNAKLNTDTVYAIISRNYEVQMTACDLSELALSYILKSRRIGSDLMITPNFSNMDLSNVNYSGSNLKGAIFLNSNLKKANFTDSNLQETIFDGSNISGANFSGAINYSPLQFIKSHGIENAKGFTQEFITHVNILRSNNNNKNLYDNKFVRAIFDIALKYNLPTNILMNLFPDYAELAIANYTTKSGNKKTFQDSFDISTPYTPGSSRDMIEKTPHNHNIHIKKMR